MRRTLLVLLALVFAIPVAEAAKTKTVKSKKPVRTVASGKLPSRVFTFACRESENGQENVMGLTHMAVDLRDENSGVFSMSLYLRTEKSYATKTLTGSYVTVPGGFVLTTKWGSATSDYTVMNIHPADKTIFPGINARQSCAVTAQLISP